MRDARHLLTRDGERKLDGRVRREGIHASAREEVRRAPCSAEDLQEDGDGRRRERRAIDEEACVVEREVEVQRVVHAPLARIPGSRGVIEWHEVRFG